MKRVDPFGSQDEVQSIWLDLQSRSQHSFFTSWGWIGTWIHCLPRDQDLSLIVRYVSGLPVVAFFLGVRTGVKRKIFKKKRAYLNTTGDDALDDLTIEYNGALVDEQADCGGSIFSEELLGDIEEFRLPGVTICGSQSPLYDDSFFEYVTESRPSYFVDLKKIRSEGTDYLACVSANKRRQIRRSLKELQSDGPIRIREAQDKNEAQRMYSDLVGLHQIEWGRRGEKGAFDSGFLNSFHKHLIDTRFEKGEVQLLEIFNDGGSVGYLYNFCYENEVLFYQSGFVYRPEQNWRPGIVSHYLAIEHNLRRGFDKYDFLAGEEQYKKSLSNCQSEMHWIIVCRKDCKARLERLLIRAWNIFNS